MSTAAVKPSSVESAAVDTPVAKDKPCWLVHVEQTLLADHEFDSEQRDVLKILHIMLEARDDDRTAASDAANESLNTSSNYALLRSIPTMKWW